MSAPFWRVLWQVNGEPAADLYTPAAGRARAIAQAIATAHGARMILADLTNEDTIEYTPARHNPTLHRHGASRARWHVLTHGDNHAVADLYGFQPQAAIRLVQAMASELGRRLVIVANDQAPEGTPLHAHSVLRSRSGAPYHESESRQNPHRGPKPVAGQSWRGVMDGAVDRIMSVSGSRVQVLHAETGNREWFDLGEFVATHRPAGAARKNPNRGAGPYVVFDDSGRVIWRGTASSIKQAIAAARRDIPREPFDPPRPWGAFRDDAGAAPPVGRRHNPTLRISGTIKVGRAARRRSRRPARARRPKLAIVPRARAKRGRSEHARRALESGEGVTVPYTGRSSYFGRPVKRTTEPATVLGYTDSSAGGRMVQVQVRRGRSAEVHEFPEHQVRRRPSRALRYKSESEKHPEVRQRLEAAVGGDVSKGLHLLELAHNELDAANQTAEALRPQAGEKSSPDYLAARRTEKKALARTQALEGIVRRIQESQPGYADPFAIANGRRRGQRARAEKTFRMWHEFDSSRTSKVRGPDRVIPGTLVKLGDLISVTYRSDKYAGGPDNPSGKPLLYEHKTKRPHPVLATDPEGKFVHIVGGRMTVTGDGLVN